MVKEMHDNPNWSDEYRRDYHAGLQQYRREFLQMRNILIWHDDMGMSEREVVQWNRLNHAKETIPYGLQRKVDAALWVSC